MDITNHIHPMFVHFPIALVIIGFVADLTSHFIKKEACLSKAGFYMLLAGTVMAVLALLSGLLFTSEMEGAADEISDTHQLFAWIAVSLLIVTSLLRIYLASQKSEKSKLKLLAFALYALAVVFVGLTGFYGGTLVYDYMIPL